MDGDISGGNVEIDNVENSDDDDDEYHDESFTLRA